METLSAAAADAIRRHMNEDHADAVAGYARTHAHLPRVESATIEAIDAHAMQLAVQTGTERTLVHVAFDHVLQNSDDARDTLIAMARGSA